MSLGDNIKKHREMRNLRQSELAEMIGVSDKTVSSWEINRTEPKMGMVERICQALNCKKTDIIGNDLLIEYTYTDKSELFKRLYIYYQMLNELGKKEAAKRIEELTHIPSYTSTENNVPDYYSMVPEFPPDMDVNTDVKKNDADSKKMA